MDKLEILTTDEAVRVQYKSVHPRLLPTIALSRSSIVNTTRAKISSRKCKQHGRAIKLFFSNPVTNSGTIKQKSNRLLQTEW